MMALKEGSKYHFFSVWQLFPQMKDLWKRETPITCAVIHQLMQALFFLFSRRIIILTSGFLWCCLLLFYFWIVIWLLLHKLWIAANKMKLTLPNLVIHAWWFTQYWEGNNLQKCRLDVHFYSTRNALLFVDEILYTFPVKWNSTGPRKKLFSFFRAFQFMQDTQFFVCL